MMSKPLDKATQQFQAGQYKKAANTLYEVSFGGDDGEAEARGVLSLATLLRDATEGSVRAQCEENIARAERLLHSEERISAQSRIDRLEADLRQDPVGLARWAREAGLTWLEVASDEDLVAAQMRSAMAAEGAGDAVTTCVIDAVEAEGWRLEHVSSLFRPTWLQTSPLRGADFFMGGDVVEGHETYLYLFRRIHGASG